MRSIIIVVFASLITWTPLVVLAQSPQHVYSTIVAQVTQRLKQNRYKMPVFHVGLVDSKGINAYSNVKTGQIIVTNGLVAFLAHDPGELAFAIAHEVGHIEGAPCHEGQSQNLGLGAFLANKFANQKCETTADQIGLLYMMGAKLNPYDAAAFFGRMAMLQGDTGIKGLKARFESDHPINIERIANLRKLLLQVCSEAGVRCAE